MLAGMTPFEHVGTSGRAQLQLAIAVLLFAGVGAVRPVRNERELHAALCNLDVAVIELEADIKLQNTSLWSAPVQPTEHTFRSNLVIRSSQHLRATAVLPALGARHVSQQQNVAAAANDVPRGLAQLDMGLLQGWLQLKPNTSLVLEGLLLRYQQPSQPDLLPYHTLLTALLYTASGNSAATGQRLSFVAVSLVDCVDQADVGLPQGTAIAALAALPPVPAPYLLAADNLFPATNITFNTTSSSGNDNLGAAALDNASAQEPVAAALPGQLCISAAGPGNGTHCTDSAVEVTHIRTALEASSDTTWRYKAASGDGYEGAGPAGTAAGSGPSTVVLLDVRRSLSASMMQVDPQCLQQYRTDVCVAQAQMRVYGISGSEQLPLPPPSPPAMLQGTLGASGDNGSADRAAFTAILATLLPIATVLLLCLLVLCYLYHRVRRRLRDQHRRTMSAPGVGPLTTVLVTDIANSTALWESLPGEVMDVALRLHHACIRSVLLHYNGYESATEGDSFVLAFHGPVDASRFALTVQLQLMDIVWPAEVLAHPDGQELWVQPRTDDNAPGDLNTLSALLRSLSSIGGGGGSGGVAVPRGDSANRRGSWGLPSKPRVTTVASVTATASGAGTSRAMDFDGLLETGGAGGIGMGMGERELDARGRYARSLTEQLSGACPGAAGVVGDSASTGAAGGAGAGGRWGAGRGRGGSSSASVRGLPGEGHSRPTSRMRSFLASSLARLGSVTGCSGSMRSAHLHVPADMLLMSSIDTDVHSPHAQSFVAAQTRSQQQGVAGVSSKPPATGDSFYGPRALLKQALSFRGSSRRGAVGGPGPRVAQGLAAVVSISGAKEDKVGITVALAPSQCLEETAGVLSGPRSRLGVGDQATSAPLSHAGGPLLHNAAGSSQVAGSREPSGLLSPPRGDTSARRSVVVPLGFGAHSRARAHLGDAEEALERGQRGVQAGQDSTEDRESMVAGGMGLTDAAAHRSPVEAGVHDRSTSSGHWAPPVRPGVGLAPRNSPLASNSFHRAVAVSGLVHTTAGAPYMQLPAASGTSMATRLSPSFGNFTDGAAMLLVSLDDASINMVPHFSTDGLGSSGSAAAHMLRSLHNDRATREDPPAEQLSSSTAALWNAVQEAGRSSNPGNLQCFLDRPPSRECTQEGRVQSSPALPALDDTSVGKTGVSLVIAEGSGMASGNLGRTPEPSGASLSCSVGSSGHAATWITGVRSATDGARGGGVPGGYRRVMAAAGMAARPAVVSLATAESMGQVRGMSHLMSRGLPSGWEIQRERMQGSTTCGAVHGTQGQGNKSTALAEGSRHVAGPSLDELLAVDSSKTALTISDADTPRPAARQPPHLPPDRSALKALRMQGQHTSASLATSKSSTQAGLVSTLTTSAAVPTLLPPPIIGRVPVAGGGSRRLSLLGLTLSRSRKRRASLDDWTLQSGADTHHLGSLTGGGSQYGIADARLVCVSYRERCREEWPLAQRPAPPARCAFRGLRVRMGLHTGIASAVDVTFNPTTSHMAYGGTAMKVAKAVGDAAGGGMVLISQSTFQALVRQLAELPGPPQALFSGESDLGLGPGSAPLSLYQLVHPQLAQRVGYCAPMRNIPLLQLGTEEAPTGFVAISFMHVASASMLVAELGQPGIEALQSFKDIAIRLCCKAGGYVVEASEGLCLAAFRHPAAALVWALAANEALAAHTWGNEVCRWYRVARASQTQQPQHDGGGQAASCSWTGGRGPRPRTGVHVGVVHAEVNAVTGRMSYRGKVMNRTSRIAHKASSGQVLCSQEAWEAVQDSLAKMAQQLEEEEEEHKRQEADKAVLAGAGAGGSGRGGVQQSGSAAGGGGISRRASAKAAALTPTRSGMLRALRFVGSQKLRRAVTGLNLSSGGGGSGGATAGAGLPLSLLPPPSSVSGFVRAAGARPRPAGFHRSVSVSNMTATVAAVAAPVAALGRRMWSFTLTKYDASGRDAAAVGDGTCSSGADMPTSPRVRGAPADGAHRTAAAAAIVAGESAGGSFRECRLTRPASPLGTTAASAALHPGATPADHSGPMPSLSLGIQGPPNPRHGDPLPFCVQPLALPSRANLSPTITLLPDPGRATRDSTAQWSATLQAPAALIRSSFSSSSSSRVDLQDEPPTREWQALCTLVGPKLELPRGMRLHAKLLGSYSLKGVREEMKLYEVVWVAEVQAAALGGPAGTEDGTLSGGLTRANTARSPGLGCGGGAVGVSALKTYVENGGMGLPPDASGGTRVATAVAAVAAASTRQEGPH